MADRNIDKRIRKEHALSGRRQSPEHVAKRVASIAATKATWSMAKKQQVAKNVGAAAKARPKSTYKNTPLFKNGQTPWNKGNRWTDGLSPDELRALAAARARKRRQTSPRARLHARMSSLVRNYLKRRQIPKDGRSWESLVGYTARQLEQRLKKTIPDGYKWDNYLNGDLQLDHIVPVSAHNFASTEDIDFKKCWSLKNLRLITKEENQEKRAKLLKPFQPALLVSLP